MAAVSFSLVALLTGWYISAASRRRWFEIPNHRSSHRQPTPRAGGIPMVVMLLLSMIWLFSLSEVPGPLFWVLILGGSPLAFVSALDDFSPIAPKVRLFCQFVACSLAVVVLMGGHWNLVPQITVELSRGWWPLGVLTALWLVNLFNFMDGIDGIAAVEGICLFAGLALVHAFTELSGEAIPMLSIMVACIIGFLVWNWSPAKVFMGDVGSIFLGYTFVVVALWGIKAGWWVVWVPFILSASFWLDATITLVRRWRRGEKVSEPHRSHAYQRLARRWDSHQKVSILFGAVNVVWLWPMAVMSTVYERFGLVFLLVSMMPLAYGVWKIGAGLSDD